MKSGPFRADDPRVAEINAYDAAAKRIFVVNPLMGRAACPLRTGLEPNSLAILGHLLAVAIANNPRTDNGHAVYFELRGALPPRFVAALEWAPVRTCSSSPTTASTP